MANITLTNEVSLYDTRGAIIYIIGVLIWYSIGFGLILINNINPRTGRIKMYRNTNVYQTFNSLQEQKKRNDILNELKDENKRNKLWDIYYGNNKQNSPLNIEKDKEIINSIMKQIIELNEQRRLLENTLNDINLEQLNIDETENSNN